MNWRKILTWEVDALPFHPGDRVRLVKVSPKVATYAAGAVIFTLQDGDLGTVTAYSEAHEYAEVEWDGYPTVQELYEDEPELAGWIINKEFIELI